MVCSTGNNIVEPGWPLFKEHALPSVLELDADRFLLLTCEVSFEAPRAHILPQQSRGRSQSGNPNTRLARIFNCTSDVPPSIELAFDRNQARGAEFVVFELFSAPAQ